MKRSFVVGKEDRVLWAMCIAAYVLVADYFSPLSIVRAELTEGSMVEERPFGTTPTEDRFIIIVATLAIYAALEPDTYKPTYLDQIPSSVMEMIASLIRDRGEEVNDEAVRKEQDRLLAIATDVLRKNHLYHLQLAAALIKGPVATDEIEKLKSRYCTNINHAA